MTAFSRNRDGNIPCRPDNPYASSEDDASYEENGQLSRHS